MTLNEKEMVDEIKVEWKRLWQERVDDKIRAEGVAANDYNSLFIEKGTVIHATRDFKDLNFKEILHQHEVANADRYIIPDPKVGGWNKFVKDNITNKKPQKSSRCELIRGEQKKPSTNKKGGRGWLNL